MNTDDLKAAWQAMDKRFERENQLSWQLLRDQRLSRIHRSLRPLVWGQCMQIGLGICMILLSTTLWSVQPVGLTIIFAGVVVNVYGVVCIISAGVVLSGLRELDYAEPVLAIQTQLAIVRRRYIISGMIAGLPWWFMWLAVIIVLSGLSGADLYAASPLTVWSGIVIGVVGLTATALFHVWSRSAKRPDLAKSMNNAVTGRSLRSAYNQLDELKRFEIDD